ncbi:F-box/kelch-repeat protein At1g80440 [Mercurialis annua]|uniref:F-box/kelch-repeat protein At1g80440 n=1 Tax=Mercurialis annua TaxID=3986 RepID=UPI00215E69BE|nr:F-box/kelch-repeat protein At1g80440 [Mercurialis annua]
MDLIPGLNDDVARDCLVRVMYNQFSSVISVCKSWRDELELPEFFRLRRDSCKSQKLIVMAQARVDQNSGSNSSLFKLRFNPVYRLTVLEPDTGDWCDLPPVPGFSDGLPMFCQVVGVGSELVVLGGLDPDTWEVSDSVYVFNFVSATWRRGADMPGLRRSFFGCASDLDRMVYVAGGHDSEKNALGSVLAYDVENNEWVPLPDMAKERDECKAIFQGGKLHVIGGYCTEMQGRFETSAEVFDVATFKWNDVQEDLLLAATCPRTCVSSDDVLYICHLGDVMALKGATWQAVAKLPVDVYNVAYVATWQGNLLVIGSESFGEPYVAYVLDLKSYSWRKIESPKEYSGHVQSSCYLEI